MKNSPRPAFSKAAPRSDKARSPAKSGGGTLLGLFIGLVLGMLIALAVVWYLRKAPLPFESKGLATAPAPAVGSPKILAPPGKTDAEAAAKPRFDFYGILEGKQTAAPPTDARPDTPPLPPAPTKPVEARVDAKASTGEPSPATPKELLYLQAGAFQKAGDADNLKAKLTLLGLEAEVTEADIPEKGRMFRVRTGPYGSSDEMNKARLQLSQAGVQAALVKAH